MTITVIVKTTFGHRMIAGAEDTETDQEIIDRIRDSFDVEVKRIVKRKPLPSSEETGITL